MGKNDRLILIVIRDDSRIRQFEFRFIWLQIMLYSLALLLLATVSITALLYSQWKGHMEVVSNYAAIQEKISEEQMKMEEMKQKVEMHAQAVHEHNDLPIINTHRPPAIQDASADLNRLFYQKDLNKVSVANMQLQFQNKYMRLRFELHNLTDNLLAGEIFVYVIARNAAIFQVQSKDDEMSFAIRNFRAVNFLLEPPSGLTPEEVFGLRLAISSTNGHQLFTQVYIMSELLGNG